MTIINHNFVRAGVSGLLVALLVVLLGGCQLSQPFLVGEGYGLLVGQVPPVQGGSILLRSVQGEEKRVAIDAKGQYTARLKTGRYQVLLEGPDSTLTLVKSAVNVEDNLTVSLLDVSLVPLPQVQTVSVPLVLADSAVVEWETNIAADGRIDYGFDEQYGMSTHTDTEHKTRHRLQLNSLQPGRTYHFRIVSSRHGLEAVQTFTRDYRFTTETAATP